MYFYNNSLNFNADESRFIPKFSNSREENEIGWNFREVRKITGNIAVFLLLKGS